VPDDNRAGALIDRIVAAAVVPNRAEREDLRRELRSHFDECGASSPDLDAALRRFGSEASVAESLRRVYRVDRAFWYGVKLAGSIAASLAAVIAIEALVNLPALAAAGWRLAPEFLRGVAVSTIVVVGLVAAFEAVRTPFSRRRAAAAVAAYGAIVAILTVAIPPMGFTLAMATTLVAAAQLSTTLDGALQRIAMLCAVFAAIVFGSHLALGVLLSAARAASAGAVFAAVWCTTTQIVTRLDAAFADRLAPPSRVRALRA
jgi:hypothetical protein